MTRTPIDSPSPLATQKLEYGPARRGLRWVGKCNMTRRSRYFLESLPWPRGSSLVFGVREFVSPSPPSLWFNQISSNLWGRWPCGNINHYVIHWRSILGLPLYLRHGHIASRGFESFETFWVQVASQRKKLDIAYHPPFRIWPFFFELAISRTPKIRKKRGFWI